LKITIDPFDKKSINAALKQLERYEKEFLKKEEEFVRRLKELGVSVATKGFALADYDGVNDVLIAETQLGPRALVIAYGETVGFIEFGTGVKFREYNSAGLEYTPPAHGTYGKGRGKNAYGWYFKQGEGAAARHTYGNPPAEAMLTARNAMIEQVVQIAREVWK
jgi:hypothetical protein